MNEDEKFEAWLRAVDVEIGARLAGLSHDDLPDCCYRDWFDDEMTPKDAALEAIEYTGE